jgi:hypothetical protein
MQLSLTFYALFYGFHGYLLLGLRPTSQDYLFLHDTNMLNNNTKSI